MNERQIKNLQFRNPGPALGNFDPEKSHRQRQKIQRMIKQAAQKGKKRLYDEGGLLVIDGRDVCDCLIETCPGCFYPCDTCRSAKCGIECRTQRRWHYECIDVEGGVTREFPEGDGDPNN